MKSLDGRFGVVLLVSLGPFFPACGSGEKNEALESSSTSPSAARERARELYAEVLRNPFDEGVLAAYVATLPRDGELVVVEGDLLLTKDELREYLVAAAESRTRAEVEIQPELSVRVLADGGRDFWQDPRSRRLSYAVDRASFPDEERYRRTAEAMRAATEDWEEICEECAVDFVHLTEHDREPSQERVTFIVSYRDVRGSDIAAAFFPSYPPSRRFVNIYPSYFTTSLDPVGVLRHELGHVLGYRHEHSRGVRGCYFEDAKWLPLTPYDPHSVMHYFCGGGGSRALELTALDREGHVSLYGPTRESRAALRK